MKRVSLGNVVAASWFFVVPASGVMAEVASWTDVAQQLVARRSATSEGVVDYRVYGFQVDVATFDHLAALLLPTQAAPNPLLTDEVDAWMDTHLPATHGAMRGWCTYDGSLWQDQKKVMEADTLQEALTAHAMDSGATAIKMTEVVVTHSDGTTETVVQDHRSVRLRNARADAHAMVPLDMSLFDWQQAIDQGPAPDQTITWEADGAAHSIIFTNGAPGDGHYSGAEQSFSEALDWAPLRATAHFQGTRQFDQVYAYRDDGGDGLARPAVVLEGTFLDGGLVQVNLWVVENWQEWSNPEWLLLRLPPYHLRLDYRADPNPPLVIHRPSYLENVPRSKQWVRLAMSRVLTEWEGYDPEVDFNCDGVIDAEDNKVLNRVLFPDVEQ
jgi:hypothetical protein